MRVRCSFCGYRCLGGLMRWVADEWIWCGACSDGATFVAHSQSARPVSLDQLIREHGVHDARQMVKRR